MKKKTVHIKTMIPIKPPKIKPWQKGHILIPAYGPFSYVVAEHETDVVDELINKLIKGIA